MIPSSSITMGKSTTIPSNRDSRGPIPYQRRTFRPKTSKWLLKVSISSFQRTLIRRISPRWRILTWCRREGDFTGRFAPRPAGRRAEHGAPISDKTKAARHAAGSHISKNLLLKVTQIFFLVYSCLFIRFLIFLYNIRNRVNFYFWKSCLLPTNS